MKQLEVSILGQVYMLGCPEGGEALLQAAVAAVDREMSSIRDSGKVKARERIAVLSAASTRPWAKTASFCEFRRGPTPHAGRGRGLE
jgi:hypothetical protein